LEKLLLVAADLLDSENLQRPEGFNDILESLRSRYGKLLDAEVVALESGVSLSTERLRNTLRRYAADLSSSASAGQRQRDKQQRSFQVNLHLGTLLSPKQRELVLKRLEGKPLSKTEQEYYSRVVKKKLEALANSDVRRIAVTLLRR
jgi:hypothetical protein